MGLNGLISFIRSNGLLLGALIRVVLLIYGYIQDTYLDVKYTDIDYIVYSDAAQHVLEGHSPYQRLTYRYTPLLSYMLVGNFVFFYDFGKIIFVVCDLFIGVLIEKILKLQNVSDERAKDMSLLWLLNPLAFNISTRGNADSIVSFLILGTIYFILKKRVIIAALLYGFAVHFRIYPIIYSLTFYFFIDWKTNNKTLKLITKDRLVFTIISAGVFVGLAALFYQIYGYEFAFETYLYHFARKDNRHNFSIYFYILYLLYNSNATLIGLVSFIPQWILMIYSGLRLKYDLFLALYTQTVIFVIFNKVCTAQYFLWYITLLPLLIPRMTMSKKQGLVLVAIWFATEVSWLLSAFQLEFMGLNSFIYIWIASVGFFLANLVILRSVIKSSLFVETIREGEIPSGITTEEVETSLKKAGASKK